MAKNIFTRSKSFKSALNKAGKIATDKEGLNDLLTKTKDKIKSIEGEHGIIHALFEKLMTFIRMVRAFITGEYKDLPLKTMILIVAGLLYFIMPIDFIPDFIPGLGLVDDASIVLAVFKSISSDVKNFEEFERQNQ